MGLTAKQRRRRNLMWMEDRRCHWCGRKTRHPKVCVKDGRQPKDTATLDHLDGRLLGRRGKYNGQPRTVLACRECNEQRGKMEQIIYRFITGEREADG